MGCFSYLCKKCGKGITSSSFDGQKCILFLLKEGTIVEKIEGRYDSYGKVFSKGGSHKLLTTPIGEIDKHFKQEKKKGKIVWEYDDWGNLVDLHFNDNKSDGFAAYHKKCYSDEVPIEKSDDDPDQGWGEDGEYMGQTGKVKE